MIVASYLALFITVLLWTRDRARRTWLQRANRPIIVAVRVGASVVCVLLMLVGVLLLADSAPGEIAVVAGITLVAGASVLLLGIGVWKGGFARILRTVGWLVVVALLCVPSTLTLLLVPVAPMVVLLERVQSVSRSHERDEIVLE